MGELVLTNLGRLGSPLIRYRTGDLVRVDPRAVPVRPGAGCGWTVASWAGRDDMIHLRGNNVYPSALEAVLRRFAEVVEYRVEVDRTGTLAELRDRGRAGARAARRRPGRARSAGRSATSCCSGPR